MFDIFLYVLLALFAVCMSGFVWCIMREMLGSGERMLDKALDCIGLALVCVVVFCIVGIVRLLLGVIL